MNRKEIRRLEKNEELNILDKLILIIKKYFNGIPKMFKSLTDCRHKRYIKYDIDTIIMVALFGKICDQKTMRSMTNNFNTTNAIKNFSNILNTELTELPHYDTINDVIKNINVDEFSNIINKTLQHLLRTKMFDKYRYMNKYFNIVVDATCFYSGDKKIFKNTITKEIKDKETGEVIKKIYQNDVLEAKLVVGDMVFSIGSEFIESTDCNPKEKNAQKRKQDCEINAFKRLAPKIKKAFPKLPIILSGDALYACSSITNICKLNNWEYVIRFKEGRIKSLGENIEGLEKLYNNEYGDYKIRGWNDVHSGNATKSDPGKLYNIIEQKEVSKEKTLEFKWITSFKITNKNIEELCLVGRKRWKIENKGFNEQKNGIFDITHLCCYDLNGMKIHYLIIQLAHMIIQLLEKGGQIDMRVYKTKKRVSFKILQKLTLFKINLDINSTKNIQLRFIE